jgi:hypothetical protein
VLLADRLNTTHRRSLAFFVRSRAEALVDPVDLGLGKDRRYVRERIEAESITPRPLKLLRL